MSWQSLKSTTSSPSTRTWSVPWCGPACSPAEAIIDAVADDNPGRDVLVLDRDDYVRIHTAQTCRLTRASLERHLGQPVQLATLEIDMPAFKGLGCVPAPMSTSGSTTSDPPSTTSSTKRLRRASMTTEHAVASTSTGASPSAGAKPRTRRRPGPRSATWADGPANTRSSPTDLTTPPDSPRSSSGPTCTVTGGFGSTGMR